MVFIVCQGNQEIDKVWTDLKIQLMELNWLPHNAQLGEAACVYFVLVILLVLYPLLSKDLFTDIICSSVTP